jgi:hypothetical protein
MKNPIIREPFTTIDDLVQLSQQLFVGLRKLGKRKHPLMVRKGRGVKKMTDQSESKMVKAGATTYFFDIKLTKEKKPFLVISASRFKGEGEARERASMTLFSEHSQAFIEALQEMAAKLS